MKQVLRETDSFFAEYLPEVSRKLLYTIFVVFLVVNVGLMFGLQDLIRRIFFLVPNQAVYQLNLWQFFTYGLTHVDFSHLFSNALGLFFFAGLVERQMGDRRFLWFVILNIAVAGVLHTVVSMATGHSGRPIIGISAAIYAIVIATAVWFPRMRVLFMFIIPIPMRVLAFLFILFTFMGFAADNSGVSHLAHLSGILLGFILVKNPGILDWFEDRRIPFLMRRRPKVIRGGRTGMGHPGRHSDPDELYDDPHWKLDQ